MTIRAEVGTVLAEGWDTTDGTTFSSADCTPTAGRLVLLLVAQSGTTPTAPTISGTGWASGLSWNSGPSNPQGGNTRVSMFWAYCPASPTSGHVTMTFGSTQTSCGWSLFDVTNAHASSPIGQSSSDMGSGATAGSVTVSSTNSRNAMVGAFRHSQNETATAGDGSLVGTPQHGATPGGSLGVEFTDTATSISMTVDMSWSTNSAWTGIAFEVLPTLSRDVGTATETDTAGFIHFSPTRVTMAQATETDTAQTIRHARRGDIGQVLEHQTAMPMRVRKGAPVSGGWGTEPWGLFPWGDPGGPAPQPSPVQAFIVAPGPDDLLWVKVTGPDGRTDYPEWVDSLQLDESAPGGFLNFSGEIEYDRAMDLREVYTDGAVVEVFSSTGLQKFYGWLLDPSKSRSTGRAILKADGVGRDAENEAGRLCYATADPSQWVARNSSGFGPNGDGFYVQGEENFSLDNEGHLQVTVAKGSDMHDKDQMGWIIWVPDVSPRRQGWKFIQGHIHTKPSGPAYSVKIASGPGPEGFDGLYALLGRATISLPSGGDQDKDFSVDLTEPDDLLNIELYRNGDDASTDNAVQVTLTRVLAGMLATSPEMTVSEVATDLAGRLGWDPRRVKSHPFVAMPFDQQQGTYADALDYMSLLVDWRYLGLAIPGLGPVMEFGPWNTRVWTATDPEWAFDPIPVQRYDAVVVPCRQANGTAGEVIGWAEERLPKHRKFTGVALDDPLPAREPAQDLAVNLANYLVEERYAGEMTLTEVTDALGGRWPASVLLAGDTLITEVGPLRIKDLTSNQTADERSTRVVFDDRYAALDKKIARRAQRLRAQGLLS